MLASFVASVLLPSIAIGEEPNATVSEDSAVGGDEAHLNVSVFYATNRRQNGDEAAAEIFSGERGEPRYGQCRVEFTPIPIINQLELYRTPSRLETREPTHVNSPRVL